MIVIYGFPVVKNNIREGCAKNNRREDLAKNNIREDRVDVGGDDLVGHPQKSVVCRQQG